MSEIVVAASITAAPAMFAVVMSWRSARSSRRTERHVNEQLTPTNGTTIAEMIERTDKRVQRVDSRHTNEIRGLRRDFIKHLAHDHGPSTSRS